MLSVEAETRQTSRAVLYTECPDEENEQDATPFKLVHFSPRPRPPISSAHDFRFESPAPFVTAGQNIAVTHAEISRQTRSNPTENTKTGPCAGLHGAADARPGRVLPGV